MEKTKNIIAKLLNRSRAVHISRRFFLFMGLLFLTGLAALYWAVENIVIPEYLSLLEQRVQSLAYELQTTIPLLNPEQTQKTLEDIQAGEPELLYILVLNRQCQALAHSNPERVDMFFDDPTSLTTCRDGQETRQVYTRDADNPSSPFYGQKAIDLNVPLYDSQGNHIGAISLGLSLQKMVEAQRRYSTAILVGGLLLLALFLAITLIHYAEIRHPFLALAESEARYRAFFENSVTSLTIVEEDMTISMCNQSFEKLSGFSKKEIEGKRNWVEFVATSADLEKMKYYHQMRRINPLSVPDSYECKFLDRDNRIKTTVMMVGMIPNSKRSVVSMLDISELKQAQAALAEQDKLAGLGTLAAGIAHEMRSPLQIITGQSESMIRRVSNGDLDIERILNNLQSINHNGWRIAEITNALLAYARSSEQLFELHNLNEIIKGTLLLIEHQLNTWSSIKVVLELEPELPQFFCNSGQISQVLINLLNNARDAIPHGGTITLRTRYQKAVDLIILEISDTGVGIPETIKAKIFDPFFTTKPIGQGTGLGLSIVAGIVKSHGGEINVKSSEGQGALFKLAFPREKPSTEQETLDEKMGRFGDQ